MYPPALHSAHRKPSCPLAKRLQARLGRHALREHALVPPPRQPKPLERDRPLEPAAAERLRRACEALGPRRRRRRGSRACTRTARSACSPAAPPSCCSGTSSAPRRQGLYCAAEHTRDATSPPFANVPTSHGMQCLPRLRLEAAAGHVVQYGAPDVRVGAARARRAPVWTTTRARRWGSRCQPHRVGGGDLALVEARSPASHGAHTPEKLRPTACSP